MGTVDLVYDSVRGMQVAKKHLSQEHASAMVHFKREFRVLSRLLHPNLVRVWELAHDANGWHFLMEPVIGEPIDEYCKNRGVGETLRHVLPQLVDALMFIHAHGVVHRDLKPSNVLVTQSGLVKVLDFGVLGHAQSDARTEFPMVAGTPGYMAPEQIRGETPLAASDLYALGCMIFEIWAGRAVFLGTASNVLAAHLSEPPPRLAELVPEVPFLYDVICNQLLDKDPERRPTANDLTERLLVPLDAVLASMRRPPRILNELIGRDELLAELSAKLAGASMSIALEGPTGVGKSAVLEQAARELERDGVFVLRGEARPEERVAYNALDRAVDDLARALAWRRDASAEVQAAARLARRVFPVLAAAGFSAAERTKELIRFKLFGGAPPVQRNAIFHALHALIRAAANGRRTAIAIDDFQWADDDSLALLSHLLDAAEEPPTLLVSCRNDLEGGPAQAWLGQRASVEHFVVPPLDDDQVREVIARFAGSDATTESLLALAQECHGLPFLAEVAGRSLATSGDGDLTKLILRHEPLERTVLALLVAQDDWTSGPMLAELASSPLGALDDAIVALGWDGLVRRGGRAGVEGVVDVYHDGVRQTAAAALTQELADAHLRLAEYWLEQPNAPFERRVRHLVFCERWEQAAEQALLAAHAAEEQRAFGLAADMYAVALRAPPVSERQLRKARAQALEKVGRHVDAAREWAAQAELAPAAARLELALHEACALIAANQVEQGLDRLDAALVATGDPPSHSRSPRSVLTALTFALGPRGSWLRPAAPRSDVSVAKRDVRIGILLSFLDPLSGVRYLLRAQDRFGVVEERTQQAVCNYMFAVLAYVGSRKPVVPLAECYVQRARTLGRSGAPEVLAMSDFVQGLIELRKGNWAVAQGTLDRAAAAFEKTNASTERLMSASWSMMADAYRQDLPAMRRHLAWFSQYLLELDGGIIAAHVELLRGYSLFLEGDPMASREGVQRIVNMYSGRRPNVQRAGAELYRFLPDIYRDVSSKSLQGLHATIRTVRPFRFFDTMYAGPYAMIASLIEANALRCGVPNASRRRLEHYAKIVDQAPPLVAGASYRARAYAEDAAGRPERALEHLATAEKLALRFDRRLDVAIARFQRGLRLGGSEGAALQASAREAIRQAGSRELLLHEDAALR